MRALVGDESRTGGPTRASSVGHTFRTIEDSVHLLVAASARPTSDITIDPCWSAAWLHRAVMVRADKRRIRERPNAHARIVRGIKFGATRFAAITMLWVCARTPMANPMARMESGACANSSPQSARSWRGGTLSIACCSGAGAARQRGKALAGSVSAVLCRAACRVARHSALHCILVGP